MLLTCMRGKLFHEEVTTDDLFAEIARQACDLATEGVPVPLPPIRLNTCTIKSDTVGLLLVRLRLGMESACASSALAARGAGHLPERCSVKSFPFGVLRSMICVNTRYLRPTISRQDGRAKGSATGAVAIVGMILRIRRLG